MIKTIACVAKVLQNNVFVIILVFKGENMTKIQLSMDDINLLTLGRAIYTSNVEIIYTGKVQAQHLKPTTVEIGLNDAKNLLDLINQLRDGVDVSYLKEYALYRQETIDHFYEAISKAEGKDTPKDNILIVDVHAREEIKSLKDTISQLQRVIESMKPNLNAVRG